MIKDIAKELNAKELHDFTHHQFLKDSKIYETKYNGGDLYFSDKSFEGVDYPDTISFLYITRSDGKKYSQSFRISCIAIQTQGIRYMLDIMVNEHLEDIKNEK